MRARNPSSASSPYAKKSSSKPPIRSSMDFRYMAAQPSGQSTSSSRSNWPLSIAPAPRPRFCPSGKIRWPTLSIRRGSSHTSTLLAAIPTSGAREQARWSAASHPGSASASLFSKRDEFAAGSRDPLVIGGAEAAIGFVPNNGRAESARRRRANRRSTRYLPRSSRNPRPSCRRSDSRQARSSSLRFQLTTTTEINEYANSSGGAPVLRVTEPGDVHFYSYLPVVR